LTIGLNLTTSQKGKIVELYVASILMAATKGRLSAFVPLSDDDGVDLIVLDKETKTSLPVQIKGAFLKEEAKRPQVHFDLRHATYDETGHTLVIAIALDAETMLFRSAWAIPSKEIPQIANKTKTNYQLHPNASMSAKDKYAPYRHASIQSLAESVLKVIEAKNR
jgi:hypothetical protein